MEVDNSNFVFQLLPILRAIRDASFVAIDVEMSGISTRPRYGANDRSHDVAKPSLQQQYEETKRAAETYQVLQIGLTCVQEDRERGIYVARPYNFYVSPLFVHDDKLDIGRDITFSTSAIQFLQKNSFDMGAVFSRGVPYLSQQEEAAARLKYAEKQCRSSSIPDIIIPPGDVKALDFYRKARQTISSWIGQKKWEIDFVNIGGPGGLNGFQRRLVHQLVRTEFPTLRTFSRQNGEFMQVEKIDPGKEAELAKSRLQSFEAGLAKQIGLRFIFEALTGGDIEGIEPKLVWATETRQPNLIDLVVKKREIRELHSALKSKTHMLVGHNLFTDLIFFYKTFIGSPPNSVMEFIQSVHTLFPQIIDTKYLATHEGDSMSTNSALKDLFDDVKHQRKPLMVLDEKHTSYLGRAKEHEAGYDSWMTAYVFVMLTAKLNAEHRLLDIAVPCLNHPDTDGVSLATAAKSKKRHNSGKNATNGSAAQKTSRELPKLKLKINDDISTANRFDSLIVEGVDGGISSSSTSPGAGVFVKDTVSAGGFDSMETSIDDGFKRVSNKQTHLRPQAPSWKGLNSCAQDSEIVSEAVGPEPHAAQLNPSSMLDLSPDEQKLDQWIPDANSSFWKTFGNRLRVYGTETEICQLSD